MKHDTQHSWREHEYSGTSHALEVVLVALLSVLLLISCFVFIVLLAGVLRGSSAGLAATFGMGLLVGITATLTGLIVRSRREQRRVPEAVATSSLANSVTHSTPHATLPDETLTDKAAPLVKESTSLDLSPTEEVSSPHLPSTPYPMATSSSALDSDELANAHEPPASSTATDRFELSSEPSSTGITLDELTTRLVGTADPLAELKNLERDISRRERAWSGHGRWSEGRGRIERLRRAAHASGMTAPPLAEGPDPDPHELPIPTGIELFLAHRLHESGLYNEDFEAPQLHIVRPHASGMFFIRVEQEQVTYGTMLVLLRIEATLNAVRFALNYYDDPAQVSEADCARLQQRITSSVAAQAAAIDTPPEVPDHADPDGEWAVRHEISHAIESCQVPYRLNATFRTNVADGNVAIEMSITPADVFPQTYYPTGRPHDMPLKASRQMRRQFASSYALRLALFLAASAFRTSKKITHVWVAGILNTATRHDCYFSIDFDRWRFSKLNLEELDDLPHVLHPFCPVMRLEDGFLRPVQQTFALSEERFCPRRRYENISLSSRRLNAKLAHELGTDHVSGLAIGEADKRAAVAEEILRHLRAPNDKQATEHNVHTILEIAGDDPDPSVRSAAERTAAALITGAIDENPLNVAEEFVSGDQITLACAEAQRTLAHKKPQHALKLIHDVVGPIDEAGLYADSGSVEWRYFASFVDRALYNRLNDHPERSLMLVPASYYYAHLLATMAALMSGQTTTAIDHARTLVRIAPLDTRAHLELVRCFEKAERDEDAIHQLCELLTIAHDPQSVGTAYYRMAYFQWKRGNVMASRACYALALRSIPAAAPTIAMELTTLAFQSGTVMQSPQRELTDQEVLDILEENKIPEAPAENVSTAFLECTRAALDAEIFPVARSFVSTLTSFTPDDVLVGIMRSLEDAPDSF